MRKTIELIPRSRRSASGESELSFCRASAGRLFSIIVIGLLLSCGATENETEESIDNDRPEADEEAMTDENSQYPIARDMTAEEFKARIADGGIQLLDVRTAEEYANGFIEGAVNIDFYAEDFEAQILDSLKTDVPVLVYCMAGGRSSKAMAMLEKNEFREVYNLLGGYSEWPY
ncbi:rhodanese-like domain-containing protein [Crocinitomix catalasitica]|nr:rhodanese-like domain-containing protein [Crocinitomix catalasitica]